MKQFHQHRNRQNLKAFYLIKLAMLAPFKKEAVLEYQANLDEPIKMNTKFIIIAGLISLIMDYLTLFYSSFQSNGSSINSAAYYIIMRIILITSNMLSMGFWLIFIKRSCHTLSILAEIACILFSLAIFIHGAVTRVSNIENNIGKISGFEYLYIGLSVCARFGASNVFIRYGLLKLFYCFSMVLTLIIIETIKETQDPPSLYAKGIVILIYLCFIVLVFERIKLRTFESKNILEQNDKIFKEIMNYIPENILIIGKKGNVKYANMHLMDFFKISDQKLFSFEKLYNIKQIRKHLDIGSISNSYKLIRSEKNQDGIRSEQDFLSDDQYTSKCTKDEKNYESLIELINNILNDPEYMSNLNKLFTFHGSYQEYNTEQSLRLFEIKIKPSIVQEEPHLIIILRDITEREIIALLEESNNYKNDLLSSFSHELRTPLNCQINYLEAAIINPVLDNQIKVSCLIPALQSCKLLKLLINDILDLSSINNNNIALEINGLALESTLNQCIELITLQASRKNINLELEIDPKLPSIINTDHNKVAQIVVSLLSNSLKFTQENGKIQVIVRFDNPNIIVMIIDSGIGMTEDEQVRLRERLETHHEYKRINKKRDGIGIGLTISHSLAKLLGPKDGIGLTFESKKYSGTKFSFTILDIIEKEPSLENALGETEANFNTSSQNEFINVNPNYNHIHSFKLIQALDNFNSKNISTKSKIMIDKNLENEIFIKKSLINEEYQIININNKFDLNNDKKIRSMIGPKIQSKEKIQRIPNRNNNPTNKRDMIQKKNFINDKLNRSIICGTTYDDIIYDKTKVVNSARGIQNHSEEFEGVITRDMQVANEYSQNEQIEKNLTIKKSMINLLDYGWKDNRISHIKKQAIHSDQDLQIEKNFHCLNDLNNRSKSKIKTENHIIEKKCICPEILIVDDDSFNIMSMEYLLKQLKYTYTSVFNGKLAIDEVIKRESNKCNPLCEQYKLILMDFSMPIMNGVEATKILKEKMKIGLIKPIRIIACTAFASIDKRNECINAGMDDFISKPIDVAKLKDILNNYTLQLKK